MSQMTKRALVASLKDLLAEKPLDKITVTDLTEHCGVNLKLYKGNMINAGVTSPYTLYDEQTASFGEDEDYNQADANGFINLFGLPIAERAKLAKNWPTQD